MDPQSLPLTSPSGRAMGIDFGDSRIGVAICDADRRLATPHATVKRRGDRPSEHRELLALAASADVQTLVVGLPLSLDGGEGPSSRLLRREVKALKRMLADANVAMDVVLHDERLSTVEASAALTTAGVSSRRQRNVIDQTAAAVILQSWIDSGCPSADD